MDSFACGVQNALEKHAEFGKPPIEGAVKTIAGVTKVFKNNKWVNPVAPSTLQSVAHKAKSLFSASPKPNPELLNMARVYKARGNRVSYA